jgi:O-acetyl-ADP-ribose deacetylase (regulator of RNase III)
MRVPMPIARTDNISAAMWAMLIAIHQHNRQAEPLIDVVACPGLGTGIGRMPFPEAARQMALAYRHFLSPPRGINWQFAGERQRQIGLGGDLGFALPKSLSGW